MSIISTKHSVQVFSFLLSFYKQSIVRGHSLGLSRPALPPEGPHRSGALWS